MKLFYAPGACSLGIHVLLEELGQPYETHRVNLAAGEQHSPAYLALNPKAKVPALQRDAGGVLTEYGAIAHYLVSGTQLAVTGREDAALENEALDYIVGTVHGQGFARVFRPENFTPTEADKERVKERGREMIRAGFTQIAATLGTQDYLRGAFGVADTALFYVERWAGRAGTELPAPLAGHLARMTSRPAVARALADEGLA